MEEITGFARNRKTTMQGKAVVKESKEVAVADTAVDLGPPLLTQEAVARHFGISVASVERWRSDGHGPQYLKLGGKVRYRLQDVEAYLRKSLHRSTSERAETEKQE